MAVSLVVNGVEYLFPAQNDPPVWGEEVEAWAQAVTNVLGETSGIGDIPTTTFNIANNQSSAANVSGLAFDAGSVRGSVVTYSVYRNTTGGGATELVEVGTMYIGYKSIAMSWDLTIIGGGNAGMTFSITAGGQVQYQSTNITGSAYSGIMKFRASSLPQ